MKIESGIALPLHQKINFVFSAATKFIHQIKYHNNFLLGLLVNWVSGMILVSCKYSVVPKKFHLMLNLVQ